jgi:hypothetical protein
MFFLAFFLASLFILSFPNHAHALILANPQSPQEILLDTLMVSIVLTVVFSLTSALLESVFFYIFLGDFVKRFRRYFLSFVVANLAAIATFIGFQIIINGILSLIPSPLSYTYRPNAFFQFLFNALGIVMFVLPVLIKFIVIRHDFTNLTKRNILAKPIPNKTLIILFLLGTIISLAINYFAVFPALNWVL